MCGFIIFHTDYFADQCVVLPDLKSWIFRYPGRVQSVISFIFRVSIFVLILHLLSLTGVRPSYLQHFQTHSPLIYPTLWVFWLERIERVCKYRFLENWYDANPFSFLFFELCSVLVSWVSYLTTQFACGTRFKTAWSRSTVGTL